MRKQWWQRSTPDELVPRPWLHTDVIARLASILRPEWLVLEHGSGGSTLWLAARVRYVIAVEQNAAWREAVNAALPQNAAAVCSITELAPSQNVGKFDLLFIDGDPPADRGMWIQAAPTIVRPGGWVVLDNANRPEYAKERAGLQAIAVSCETYERNESFSKYFVTDFYHLAEATCPA